MSEAAIGFPEGNSDERELLLSWLGYLRGAVLRKTAGLTDEQGEWMPEGRLISLKGIVNHLTRVEWRWIEGGILGNDVSREQAEFRPDHDLTMKTVVAGYHERALFTDAVVRSLPLSAPCVGWGTEVQDLRWVLLHLINETARHAGHADATRELLDGTTGE